MTEPAPRKSDLGVRVVSAVVMVVVAGVAFWLGGLAWMVLVALVAFGVFWEWSNLAFAVSASAVARVLWLIGGAIYIGAGAFVAGYLGGVPSEATVLLLLVLLAVVATDVGAYFAGRTIGGPKIAPTISPSKTWAGLIGGMILSAAVLNASVYWILHEPLGDKWLLWVLIGALVAVIAQAGDFFESWMKRRAGVKDSGNLIPGHGGLFDRLDGLLAVLFATAILSFGLGRAV
jgi:phosphatidate cytidylyltransferase